MYYRLLRLDLPYFITLGYLIDFRKYLLFCHIFILVSFNFSSFSPLFVIILIFNTFFSFTYCSISWGVLSISFFFISFFIFRFNIIHSNIIKILFLLPYFSLFHFRSFIYLISTALARDSFIAFLLFLSHFLLLVYYWNEKLFLSFHSFLLVPTREITLWILMIVHTTKLVQVNLGKGEWLFAWSPRPNRETTRLTLPSYYINRPLMSQTQPSLLRQTLLPNLPLSSLLERAEVSCQGHFSWHGYLVLLLWLSIELEAIGYSGEFSVLRWRQDLTNFPF